MTTNGGTPLVSVGLAVRNDPERVRRCIESILAQDLGDLELVISDNASDDGTAETLREYARADARVRLTINAVNIGSHENMNRVLESARGTLFRWISADDWLEPTALSALAGAIDGRLDAIGATCGFTLHEDGCEPRSERYDGEFPDSADAARRFERMLWFFHAGEAKYDPSYGTYRREVLMRSGRLRPNERTDWLLCTELSLTGPIVHVPEQLAHRSWGLPTPAERAAFRRRLDPAHGERLRATATRLYHELGALADEADLTDLQRQRCRRALQRFWAREAIRKGRLHLSDRVRLALPERAA